MAVPTPTPSASVTPSITVSVVPVSIITDFTSTFFKKGFVGEVTVTGCNFTVGGPPVVKINGELVAINLYTDLEIKFNMPTLDSGVHTLSVVNGLGI